MQHCYTLNSLTNYKTLYGLDWLHHRQIGMNFQHNKPTSTSVLSYAYHFCQVSFVASEDREME